MVRISDILNPKDNNPEPEKDKLPVNPGSDGIAQNPPEEARDKKQAEGMQLAKAVKQQDGAGEKEIQVVKAMHQTELHPEESEKIYQHAVKTSQDILAQIKSHPQELDLSSGLEIVKQIVDRICLGDKELISLTINSSEDNYLPGHSINVCILAIEVGLGAGYNKSKLNELGIGALLCDAGMVQLMDLALTPRKLESHEYEEIKKHSAYGQKILSKAAGIPEAAILVAGQNHERINGTGYPDGLKNEQIHEYAKITAITDVYEAMTHPRAYRQAIEPHEAFRELLNMHSLGLFDTFIFKILINKIGLYPVGSWVELNTGEIGKVICANDDFPLRPQVNIIFNANREKVSGMKFINLSLQPSIYIKNSINPRDLSLKQTP